MDIAGSVESKRTLKSMPGERYDSLYYNKKSSAVELIENTATLGKFQVKLSNSTYGGTSPVTFPNLNYIGKCYLHIEIPVPNWTPTSQAVLCKGWGLALLNRIDLLIGNANISSQFLDRICMFHSLCSAKQTEDDLDFDLLMGGMAAFTTGQNQFEVINGKYTADIILDMPWSNYCQQDESKLYFDTSLLTAPITLNISFNQPNSIWGDTYDPIAANQQPTATLFYRQLELTNRNQSLRNSLFSAPGSVISYPSNFRQSFTVPFSVADQSVPMGPGSYYDVGPLNLMSFLNADLLGMTLSVHLQNELFPPTAGAPTGLHPAQPWNCLPIIDIQILFGGEPVYVAPGFSHRLISQEPTISNVCLNNTIIDTTAAPSFTQKVGSLRSYITFIDMSRLRAFCNTSTFFNTIKLPQQVLQISFKLATQYATTQADGIVKNITGPLVLHACYFYPQVLEVNSTGSVNIFYN